MFAKQRHREKERNRDEVIVHPLVHCLMLVTAGKSLELHLGVHMNQHLLLLTMHIGRNFGSEMQESILDSGV